MIRKSFTNSKATWFVPLVIYFDNKAFLVPIHTCAPAPNASGQVKLENHLPSGYAFNSVEHGNDKVLSYRIKREHNRLEGFIKQLEKIAKNLYIRKQSHRFFSSHRPVPKESVNDCWNCIEPFENDREKVLDHCHYSGKFAVQRKSINFRQAIAHNMAGYGIHHICTTINKSNSNNKFPVIPTTDEKYISLTYSVCVNSLVEKNGVRRNIYEDMQFLDSFKFMP